MPSVRARLPAQITHPRQTGHNNKMYKVYWTDNYGEAQSCEIAQLQNTLVYVDLLRKQGYNYVTMVSDYHDMVGKPGAQGAGSEYVPQLKN